MLTIRGARRRLQEWNIEVGPLKARRHEESVLTIPAPALARGAQTDLYGEPLRQILLSAREEGEKVLYYFDQDEKQFRELPSPTDANLTDADPTDTNPANAASALAAAADAITTDTNPADAAITDAATTDAASREEFLALIERARIGVLDAWEVLIEKIIHALREENLTAQINHLLKEFYRDINGRSAELAAHSAWKLVEMQQMELQQDASDLPAKKKRGRPRKDEDNGMHSGKYPVHTSQEWLALLHTASDGHYQRHFTSDENRGVLRHQRPNAPFFTETMLSDEERRASFGLEMLRQAAQSLDLDDGFIWLCISDLIAPAQPLAKGNYAGGWVDLDDVARRTLGGYAPNPAEALRRRRKVWHAIRYGARAVVGGERSVPYFDKTTGKTIETRIHTTPWQIVSQQQPVQPSLFNDEEEVVPVRVEVVASREWTALTTASDTAQFLPMGEMLGRIPPNQPSGAWARALGLAYFHWCRLHVHTALKDEPPPSRRELLEQFPSKTTSYEAVLNSDDPGRALKYWKGAEDYLRQNGFIESPVSSVKPATRKGWKEPWLAESPPWKPGPQLRPILEALAANLFAPAPRALRPTKTRKRRTSTKANAEG